MMRLVAWSGRRPHLVIGAALALAVAGGIAYRGLARDAIPDLSDPQIVLIADWMGHPADEVASRITGQLTAALDGVAGATTVRGTSMAGMAYVDVVLGPAARLAEARAEIVRRVDSLRPRLPETARLLIGPLASSTGWVFQYALVDPTRHNSSLVELRRLQDEVIGPSLASIPGVAEVAPLGGAVRQLAIEVSPDLLRNRAAAFTDVLSAVQAATAGGAQPGVAEIKALPLAPAPAKGAPAHVGEVAYVRYTRDMPSGMADLGGAWRAVGGVVIAARDADVPAVINEVRRRLAEKRALLPRGVQLVKVYDRSELIRGVESTLLRVLAEEVAVVVLVILAFLLHGRSALVPLITLPLVLLATFVAMRIFHVPATLMSLGGMGIALGIAVDADVVALEACHRRLEALGPDASPAERRAQLLAAAASFAPAILTSLLITALSFLPVFAFTGESGRLLRPLALTKTLVVGAAVLLTLTLAPALRAVLLRGQVPAEIDNPLTRGLVRLYRPFVQFALRRPFVTLATGALVVASCLPLLPRLGREFLPRVAEGDLLFMPTTLPGAPPGQAQNQLLGQDRAIAAFPEVATVFGKLGRADTATDPAPYTMAETTIRLRPRAQWPDHTRVRWYSAWAPAPLRAVLGLLWPEAGPYTPAELIAHLDQTTRVPGWVGAWTAPARARMDMMATGFRTPAGLRIVAPTAERLDALGAAVRAVVARTPGVRSAVYESLGGETRLELVPDQAALARHDVDPAVVKTTADLVLTGGQIAEHRQDGKSLRLRILPAVVNMDSMRSAADQLRDVTVRARPRAGGQPVPLALLGRPSYAAHPATLRTERGELVAYVPVDLDEGADLRGTVQRAQRELDRALSGGEIALRPGERLEWAGQYELLAAGERRLLWIVPIVALSALVLLLLQFRSLTEALIVLVSVPFALVGSVWALFLAGYPLSAPVWVGLLSVLGLAMQTGVVMVVYIDDAFHRRVREGRLHTREDIVAAHAEGTIQRLRPKLMTITTMAAALVPLSWAQGAGAEIIRRVAAPMLGGLVTSAFLTLEVLPVLYTIWRHRQLLRAQRAGVPIESVVGPPPGWARS
jgi:Cu(I)/Ag(I) efflux system membrane protein CusA/SilA